MLVGTGVLLAAGAGLLIARSAVAPILRCSRQTEQVTSALTGRGGSKSPERRNSVAWPSASRDTHALQRSAQALQHLIADASHELRTPMAALRTNVQIFLDGLLAVRDHGPGFEPLDLDHVFDRFSRPAQARRTPASGLGLAIVRQAAGPGEYASATNAADGGAVVRLAFTPSLTPSRDRLRPLARR